MKTLTAKLKRTANENAARTAYIINEQSITYRELWNKAENLSVALKKQGASPVIIYGHKSVDMVISIIACLMAQRAYVPVDAGTPTDRIDRIIQMSGSELIIKNEDISPEHISALTADEIKSQFKDASDKENNNQTAYIIFTSGSTGEPKGVPISYENLNNFVDWISGLSVLKNLRNVNVLNQASFSFDLSVADFFYSMINGHTLVGLDRTAQQNYDVMFDIIKNRNINLTVTTPTFAKLLLLNTEFNQDNFPDLKCMYFCGEQLEKETAVKLKKRFTDLTLINAYGPTEATSAVSGIEITDQMLDRDYLPVGRVKDSAVDISVKDDEIILKGKSVFSGYIGGIKGGYFSENGYNCYKTGDIGYIENDLIYCKGRKDNQIKYKGYRIELGDIENNLLKINGIEQAAVIAKYKGDTKTVKTIKAYICTSNEISDSEIKEKLSELLPCYMMPKSIIKLDKLPITSNGKLDRKRLAEL